MDRIKLILLKATIIALIVLGLAWLVYLIRRDTIIENGYYIIKVDDHHYKARQVTTLPNDAIEFFDEKSKRKVIVKDKYVLFNPKNQK